MDIRTREFIKYFKEMDSKDSRVYFGNAFSEFIECLNRVDLSNDTLQQLNAIFMKDMKMFFNNFCSETKE